VQDQVNAAVKYFKAPQTSNLSLFQGSEMTHFIINWTYSRNQCSAHMYTHIHTKWPSFLSKCTKE